MNCDKVVSQFECDDISFWKDYFISNEVNVTGRNDSETDYPISVGATSLSYIDISDSTRSTFFSMNDLDSSKDSMVQTLNDIESQCNGYINTGMTLLHTNTTDSIAPTIFLEDKLDFNDENHTAQIQSNGGGQQALHKNIDYDTKVIDNEKVIQNDDCIGIDAYVNYNEYMTDYNYALPLSPKDDFISNQDNFTAQNDIDTQCNGYTNTGITVLHTNATDPIAPTIFSADEFDSNAFQENYAAQSNGGGQQVLHKNIGYTKVIKSDEVFNRSSYTHKCRPKMSYQCSHCVYCTHDKSKIERHIVRHEPAKNIECPNCLNVYKNKNTFKKHLCQIGRYMRNLTKCSACCQVFRNRRNLKYHVRFACPKLTYDGKSISCQDCGFVIKDESALYYHKRKKCKRISTQVRNSVGL